MKLNLKPNVILIILGVALVIGLVYLFKPYEGFATQQGNVPAATQASSVTTDTPGATTTNPTTSVPQARDIEDVQERLKNFKLLVTATPPSETNLSAGDKKKVRDLKDEEPALKAKLTAALGNFNNSGFTVTEFFTLRDRIDAVTTLLKNAQITSAPANPTKIQEVQKLLSDFQTLLTQKRPENTDLEPAIKAKVIALRDKIPDTDQKLLAALAQSDITNYTSTTLENLRTNLQAAFDALKAAKVVGAGAGTVVEQQITIPKPADDAAYAAALGAEPQATVAAGEMGVVTLEQLKDVVKRIDEEKLKLVNLRSTAASVTSKIQQFENLTTNLGEYITKIEKKQIKLEDVPITPDSVSKFLEDYKRDNTPVPPLFVAAPSMPDSIKASPGISEYAGIPQGEKAVQELLSAAKDLRWSLEVRLEYDPHLKTREAMLGRIENIIKNLTTLSISETPIPPDTHDKYLKELRGLQNSFANSPPGYRGGDVGAMSRLPTDYARDPQGAPEPSAYDVSRAQGQGFGPQGETFPNGEISPDVYIRPGFVMNDEQIAHRGSAASFIPAAGGADYKQRAQDLCRQVKSAQLGGPATFGCIENPDEVGPSYDWKGNYTMVCNRLGDSWGRSYPEQFGCPPYDPTAKFSFGF